MRFLNILILILLTTGALRSQIVACDIFDLTVNIGNCTSDSTFKLGLDFQVANPTSDSFELWTINNQYLGAYALADLPVSIAQFPTGNNGTGFVRVCIQGNPNCCEIKQFLTPDCSPSPVCEIQNLAVAAGPCNADGTFPISIQFNAQNATGTEFELWTGAGQYLGAFPLNQLPLTIPNYSGNGANTDNLKVCIKDNPDCCASTVFDTPGCTPTTPNDSCKIRNLRVRALDCTTDNHYALWLNFSAPNTTQTTFSVFNAAGQALGQFPINQLPLVIPNFPWNGQSTDAVTICLGTPTTPDACCRTREFNAPACVGADCAIQELKAAPGACTSDSTYKLSIRFAAPTADSFELFAENGIFLGVFGVNQLPLVIDSFPGSGEDIDYLKVCIQDSTGHCCRILEFNAPRCRPDDCGVFNYRVETGTCAADGTYQLSLSFENGGNPPIDSFAVYSATDSLLGYFSPTNLPLSIPNYPWNGKFYDEIKLCLYFADTICCTSREILPPDCDTTTCAISNITVETGDCQNGAYPLVLNFDVQNPNNLLFEVWVGNGQYLGVFPLSQLPITIQNFPASGNDNDVIKICINDTPDCCATFEFPAPDCPPAPCEIFNLSVLTGDCTADSAYVVKINFQVQNPGNTTTFGVWANGVFFGAYNLSALPLTIQNFPWNGGANDEIKVCLITPGTIQTLCCKTLEFPVPDCLTPTGPCEIFNLVVDTGDCTSDSSYVITLDFDVQNPGGATQFGLWANGVFFGVYNLNALPLTIQNFPWNGGQNDFLKVCLLNANGGPTNCCRVAEFPVPGCLFPTPCEIFNLSVLTGDCTADSAYVVKINFQVQNPGNTTTFGVWANGVFFGAYNLSVLPLTIQNFPWNGGANDEIKVCLITPGTIQALCCKTLEFPVPDCLTPTAPCEIFNLVVDTGDCTSDSSYVITLDFDVQNPGGATQFGLWANGVFFGAYNLNALPLTIQNFPWNGGQNDFLKVCLLNANGGPTNCCRVTDFPVPGCLFSAPCEIFNLSVLTGDCTADSAYVVKINFQVQNPGNTTTFGVWANGVFFGAYNLSALPLTIQNFPWNGGANDEIKVCLITPGTIQALCCKTLEFPVPDCLTPTAPCEIFNLVVDTGDCTSDSSYVITLDFDVQNPGGATQFGLWANGVFFGVYNLNALPLTIQNFPWNGGQNDFLKVCLLNANGGPTNCCRVAEFPVPGCLFSAPCEIFDLKVIKTPCLCGQFFAIVTFQYSGGGNAGFKIVGNGVNYGNYPYNTPQPIILGPLDGDNMTNYEFAVVDLQQPGCFDEYQLGKVECTMSAVQDPAANGKLTISPNPTSQWLQVQAQINGSAQLGQGDVEILQQDGRLARALTVADAGQFALDVSDLPAGLYRLLVKTAAGRLEGTFVKQ